MSAKTELQVIKDELKLLMLRVEKYGNLCVLEYLEKDLAKRDKIPQKGGRK